MKKFLSLKIITTFFIILLFGFLFSFNKVLAEEQLVYINLREQCDRKLESVEVFKFTDGSQELFPSSYEANTVQEHTLCHEKMLFEARGFMWDIPNSGNPQIIPSFSVEATLKSDGSKLNKTVQPTFRKVTTDGITEQWVADISLQVEVDEDGDSYTPGTIIIKSPAGQQDDLEKVFFSANISNAFCGEEVPKLRIEIRRNEGGSTIFYPVADAVSIDGTSVLIEETIDLTTLGGNLETDLGGKYIIKAIGSCGDELPKEVTQEFLTSGFTTSDETGSVIFKLLNSTEDAYRLNVALQGQGPADLIANGQQKRFDDIPLGEYDYTVTLYIDEEANETAMLISEELLDVSDGTVVIGTGDPEVIVFTAGLSGLSTGSSPSGGDESNVGPEACNGSLNCANCIGRVKVSDTETRHFTSFDEAACLYDRTVSPSCKDYSGDFVYTNYFYTSIGCIDPSPSGIIVRMIQIALGISGFIILIRFGQAAFMLQKGNPEEYKEGVSIAVSAVLALLMIVLAMSGLVFLGTDLFKVFSPGTLVIT